MKTEVILGAFTALFAFSSIASALPTSNPVRRTTDYGDAFYPLVVSIKAYNMATTELIRNLGTLRILWQENIGTDEETDGGGYESDY